MTDRLFFSPDDPEGRLTYWPDEDDQIVCRHFVQDHPATGFGMCYLLGVYRAQGYSLVDAIHLVNQTFRRQHNPS
jgi:hypothetical protein